MSLRRRCRNRDTRGFGLDVRDGGAGGLFEMDLGTEDQSPQKKVGQRENDVEILVHVAVMEQVMAIEAEENPGTFHVPFLGKMHAPVDVFVSRIVECAGDGFAAEDSPFVRPAGDN